MHILVNLHEMNDHGTTTQIKGQLYMSRALKLPHAPFHYCPRWITLILSPATCKVLPVFVLDVNSIMQQVLARVWPLPLNTMFVKITHGSQGT